MVQHRLYDAVGTLPVLYDLFEVALEQRCQVVNLGAGRVSERCGGERSRNSSISSVESAEKLLTI